MSPTPRAAFALAAVGLAAVLLGPIIAIAGVIAIVVATAVDAFLARVRVDVTCEHAPVVQRATPTPFALRATEPAGLRVRTRQPLPPDLALEPQEGDAVVAGMLLARRRGRYVLDRPAIRVTGPLGLGCTHRRVGSASELLVYPDLPGARRIALAVRRGTLAEARRTRGPLGLGTTFEAVRDYVPDDDVRQINWAATARLDRPMANQYRIEQDRDVVGLVDAGRLSAAPIGDATRLDIALDALLAVCAVADELGDRCGATAFADGVVRSVRPRRAGAGGVARALFDLEPSPRESDYRRAFQAVAAAKRSFVIVFVDLVDEAAAASLIEAMPLLARRHRVCVATILDPDLESLVETVPERIDDVYAASIALDMRAAQRAVAARLRATGASVVEAAPKAFPAACVREYLQAKARARV